MVKYNKLAIGENVQIKLYFFSEDRFYLSKHVDPGEMLHHAAFHLGLLCLPKYAFTSH